jgi:DNA-binding CsgD family transcriptional regulator
VADTPSRRDGARAELKPSAAASRFSRAHGLTARETILLALLVDGVSLGHAAKLMGVSRNTVRTHLQHAFEKTGARRQAELIRLVLVAASDGSAAGQEE